MIVLKRREAKALGLIRYFTGKPCINGHVSQRNTKNKKCMACQRVEQGTWREANRDRFRELARKGSRKYRESHPDKWVEVYRAWREINADKARQATRTWREQNKDAYAAYESARRARIRAAWVCLTPNERKQVREIYAERERISAETGVLHHVDHIHPLAKGGPHHPTNLRVIPAVENQRKGDRA